MEKADEAILIAADLRGMGNLLDIARGSEEG